MNKLALMLSLFAGVVFGAFLILTIQNKGYVGKYHYYNEILEVDFSKTLRDEHVLLHEYGHHIWHTKLSDKQRLEYCDNWEKKMVKESLYAYDSCEEGYAEYYAYSHEIVRVD